MKTLILGIFLILHGLVHLLYFGQSQGLFELRPNMTWPDGSWIFSKLFGDETARLLASVCLVLTALGFLASGIGVFLAQSWWRPVVMGSAILSTVIWVAFWDGKLQMLDAKGGVGILINIAILVVVFLLRWPS